MKKELVIIAHNIRSAYNVGAFFRTSDGAGVSKIYLTGYTGIPADGQDSKLPTKAKKMITKTAIGAEKSVPWEQKKRLLPLIKKLKKEGYQIIALEKDARSIRYDKFRPEFPCALILGNEIRGVDDRIMEACDSVISIPMRGRKESLNVAVAAGIAIYSILK